MTVYYSNNFTLRIKDQTQPSWLVPVPTNQWIRIPNSRMNGWYDTVREGINPSYLELLSNYYPRSQWKAPWSPQVGLVSNPDPDGYGWTTATNTFTSWGKNKWGQIPANMDDNEKIAWSQQKDQFSGTTIDFGIHSGKEPSLFFGLGDANYPDNTVWQFVFGKDSPSWEIAVLGTTQSEYKWGVSSLDKWPVDGYTWKTDSNYFTDYNMTLEQQAPTIEGNEFYVGGPRDGDRIFKGAYFPYSYPISPSFIPDQCVDAYRFYDGTPLGSHDYRYVHIVTQGSPNVASGAPFIARWASRAQWPNDTGNSAGVCAGNLSTRLWIPAHDYKNINVVIPSWATIAGIPGGDPASLVNTGSIPIFARRDTEDVYLWVTGDSGGTGNKIVRWDRLTNTWVLFKAQAGMTGGNGALSFNYTDKYWLGNIHEQAQPTGPNQFFTIQEDTPGVAGAYQTMTLVAGAGVDATDLAKINHLTGADGLTWCDKLGKFLVMMKNDILSLVVYTIEKTGSSTLELGKFDTTPYLGLTTNNPKTEVQTQRTAGDELRFGGIFTNFQYIPEFESVIMKINARYHIYMLQV